MNQRDPRQSEPSYSGVAFASNLLALEQLVGAPAVAEALAALSHEERTLAVCAQETPWVPIALQEKLVRLAAERTGRDFDLLADEVVRVAAERAFNTVWKVLLQFSDRETLIERTALIYERARNVGSMRSRLTSPGEAEVRLDQWPALTDRQARTLAVAIESVLRLSEIADVRVTWARHAGGAVFLVRWRVEPAS